MPNEQTRMKLPTMSLSLNLAGLFLATLGLLVVAWVGWLTWYDVTSWGKDIAQIFFGSRTGEPISLGIGMKVIHYFLIGMTLLLSGLYTFIQRRRKAGKQHRRPLLHVKPQTCMHEEPSIEPQEGKGKPSSKCLHHFGYLANRSNNASVPQECLICSRLTDCMVTTAVINVKT